MRSPWNGGSMQAALAQVLVAVEQQHRARADDRAERRVGLPGAQLLGRAAEELLDDVGVEDHHEAGVEQRPERDHVAVAAAAGVDEAPGANPTRGLDEAGQPRPRRGARGRALLISGSLDFCATTGTGSPSP